MKTTIKAVRHKHGWSIQRADTIGNVIYRDHDMAIQLASLEQFEYDMADILRYANTATIH